MRTLWLVCGVAALVAVEVGCGSNGSGSGSGSGAAPEAGPSTEPDATVLDAAPDFDAGAAADATLPPNDAALPPGALDGAAPGDASLPIDAGPSIDGAPPIDAADGAVDLSAQDITFFAFGDPQFGGGPADKNSFHIQALNGAPGLVWPTDAGFASAGPVGDPRGVVIAGDLTQNGQSGRDPFNEWYLSPQYQLDMAAEYGVDASVPVIAAELGLFARDYGLRGNDGKDPFVLKYRVFEGYGNHDFDTLVPDPSADPTYYKGEAPARDIVSIRNQVRATWPEMRRFAPGNAGHYSWDWDQTHFVHLNLVASDQIGVNTDDSTGTQPPRDPQGALTFLHDDLAALVGSSCRPVVVIMHYGFDLFSEEGRWWDGAQRQAFLDVVRPYNVVAILHGHVHETRAYWMADPSAQGKTYDVFSLGSPYYQGQATNGGRGHFQVFHIKGAHIDAADVSWLPSNPDPDMANDKDLWTGKKLADLGFQITTTFNDGWGGWSYSKDIDLHACRAGYAADAGAPFCPPGADAGADAAGNLVVRQPDPGKGSASNFAFDWSDSWDGDAYQSMQSVVACGAPATSWREKGVPTGNWLKLYPDSTSQPSGQLYFLVAPLVAGTRYVASITLFGSGTYHLNIYDGAGGAGIGDNAGTPVTLDGVQATTVSVPFTMGTGVPEFQLRIDGASTFADVNVTMWGVAIALQ